jgi:quercetin dioxygenase-like cupin family protein
MHRTVTLDYSVVGGGTIELIFDSDEKKLITKGDVFVQRGTAHTWRNMTEKNDDSGIFCVFIMFQPNE